ncbi:protein asteroid homolog 1 isoform X1 [Fundulus heteroclitus]|uniref:protein asteroid homolog 1 isoform X1 n=1 Tax=Fundulus heteroclitus TaxID=8078 RepID=UPI00165BEFE0|nr:protein asteroid homolog 1 isoform X1 [Fundulus heteroclitus]XP_021180383.2 protein asteroid homolog 1 isoform X1 [Fundulus heteroclitus]XP_036000944.1 protein asteroid homolog 1 isoform X1 [Fundulus heteroclitus]
MGVQGLTTYVESNTNFLQDVRFRDSRLVIDGCSLYFRLYFNHGLDQQHGGDYDAFACLLTQFLSALAACNIQPYVLLDGGMDPSDKKFPTLRQRLQSKIKEADSLSHGRGGSVLPILVRKVFVQVLVQRGIPLIQCPAEADWDIACLARQWNCPVLTNDSDFYIFDLPAGYLPLRFFQWTNLNGKASQRYVPSRCYTTNNLCRRFGGMNRELLPLCAVLTGNDYGAPKEAETLLALIDGRALGRGGGRGRGRAPASRIEGILNWLSSFPSVAEALEEVSRLMDGEAGAGKRAQQCGLSAQLWAAMQEYNIKAQSSLAPWFSGGALAPRGKTSALAQLPECLSLAAAQGQLPPLALDAFVMQRVLLFPQVENSKLASSHCSSTAIRQAVYGILLQGSGAQPSKEAHVQMQGIRGGRGRGGRGGGGRGQQGLNEAAKAAAAQSHGFSSPVFVEEYDRLDLNLKKNQVEAIIPRNRVYLDGLSQLLSDACYIQAPAAVRLGVLFEVLAVKPSALAPVPPHLQLAVAVTGFWLREAAPRPSEPLLRALVLGMVYGELALNNQPGAAHKIPVAPQRNWATEQAFLSALDHQRVRPGERRGVDVGAAHCLSQWQSCLWSALCLNQLLLSPLPEPDLSWLFSGTLVHGLLRFQKAGWAVESLLPGASLAGQLCSCLLGAVKACSVKAGPSCPGPGKKKRGRGQGRRGRGGRGQSHGGGSVSEEVNNRFALLMSEEEYDD